MDTGAMFDKNFYGYVSLFFVVLGGVPYVISVLRGYTKPHIFSWIVWALVTAIAGMGQYTAHAGAGAWATWLGFVFCVGTVLLTFRRGEKSITRSDWVAFLMGLSAIPLWYVTSDPLPAVVLATLIDLMAYYPTFRKSYLKPHEEMAFPYITSNLRHISSILAITEYSVTTLFFSSVLFVVNTLFVVMLVLRRRHLRRHVAASKQSILHAEHPVL